MVFSDNSELWAWNPPPHVGGYVVVVPAGNAVMRKNIVQSASTSGADIRLGVWLFVFSLVLLGALAIIIRQRPGRSARKQPFGSNAVARYDWKGSRKATAWR